MKLVLVVTALVAALPKPLCPCDDDYDDDDDGDGLFGGGPGALTDGVLWPLGPTKKLKYAPPIGNTRIFSQREYFMECLF